MRKVLILGSAGMAGHVVAEYLAQKPEYEIIRCARNAVTLDTILLDVLGEVINDVDLNLRTSIIGPELKWDGTALLHWFLMQKGESLASPPLSWPGVSIIALIAG